MGNKNSSPVRQTLPLLLFVKKTSRHGTWSHDISSHLLNLPLSAAHIYESKCLPRGTYWWLHFFVLSYLRTHCVFSHHIGFVRNERVGRIKTSRANRYASDITPNHNPELLRKGRKGILLTELETDLT